MFFLFSVIADSLEGILKLQEKELPEQMFSLCNVKALKSRTLRQSKLYSKVFIWNIIHSSQYYEKYVSPHQCDVSFFLVCLFPQKLSDDFTFFFFSPYVISMYLGNQTSFCFNLTKHIGTWEMFSCHNLDTKYRLLSPRTPQL